MATESPSTGSSRPTEDVGVGARIRRYREERKLSLSQLAEDAGVSKGYLSALENASGSHTKRPSAETLYAIAKVLGVTMSDLLGRKLLTAASAEIPRSLLDFAAQDGVPEADVQMLSTIQFRGDAPRTVDRWRYIYTAIRTSEAIDG
ncbi:helix-turn-helix domain-containing protein [Kutzneria chonburiensis]|uniref:Helix-turn-helix domain-containing protein n=1 Tax=Kutzneria chonburiensis TaxID=1483604 RepID=A0ABV6MP57_9PSEU|nr:helix-turn-helix transcriptional regulator [Kutzneria chonburiensis]